MHPWPFTAVRVNHHLRFGGGSALSANMGTPRRRSLLLPSLAHDRGSVLSDGHVEHSQRLAAAVALECRLGEAGELVEVTAEDLGGCAHRRRRPGRLGTDVEVVAVVSSLSGRHIA